LARYSVRSETEWVSGPASSSKPATGSWTSRTTCMPATRALAGSRKWLPQNRNESVWRFAAKCLALSLQGAWRFAVGASQCGWRVAWRFAGSASTAAARRVLRAVASRVLRESNEEYRRNYPIAQIGAQPHRE